MNKFVKIILFLQDIYIYVLSLLNAFIKTAVLFYIKLNSSIAINNHSQILAAYTESGNDITLATKCYYKFNNVQSCCKFIEWLQKCELAGKNITMLTKDEFGKISKSIIDLVNEKELSTDTELVFGMINLDSLPSRDL